jgi:hypothetical protein
MVAVAVRHERVTPNDINTAVCRNRTLRYTLSGPAFVAVKIFDLHGRLKLEAINKSQSAGSYSLTLGRLVSSSYILDFRAGAFKTQRKIVVMK